MIDEKEMIGVTDNLGEAILESQEESLKNQVQLYENSIESLKKQKQDYLEQVAIDDEAWGIRLANPGKREDKKAFDYEFVPRYWELVKAKMEYEYRSQKATVEGTIRGFDFKISELEGQLAMTREKLEALNR